ncbi:restriction endonuclease [Rudaeicoccus suwonensis]|uniref:Restriction endonuclease n=1 Tax=Rudaeicoccus suwonensis TaxID=657409 RepID=A0A561EAT3_9MICO|nr:restriction endonuclease [Rudaeicoccus suwonensis]
MQVTDQGSVFAALVRAHGLPDWVFEPVPRTPANGLATASVGSWSSPAPEAPQRTVATPVERHTSPAPSTSVDQSLVLGVRTRLAHAAPHAFASVVEQLLTCLGYRMPTGMTSGGEAARPFVEVAVVRDPLGLDRALLRAVQLPVGWSIDRGAVRDLLTTVRAGQVRRTVMLTTGVFSEDARDAAAEADRDVVLIDGTELATLMVGQGLGVRNAATPTVQLVDDSFFTSD